MRYHIWSGVDLINGGFDTPISEKYLGFVYDLEKAKEIYKKECCECIIKANRYPKRNYFTYIVEEHDGFLESDRPNVKLPKSYTIFYKNFSRSDKAYSVEIRDGRRLEFYEIDNSWQ